MSLIQYRNGQVNHNRLATLQSELVSYQDNLAEARAQVALSLIQIYRALGGGWQNRCGRSTHAEIVADAQQSELLPPSEPEPIQKDFDGAN